MVKSSNKKPVPIVAPAQPCGESLACARRLNFDDHREIAGSLDSGIEGRNTNARSAIGMAEVVVRSELESGVESLELSQVELLDRS